MPSFGICRIQKLHAPDVALQDRHTSRGGSGGGGGDAEEQSPTYEYPPHVDPNGPRPQLLHGTPGSLTEQVRERIDQLTGGRRVRTNAVLAVEHVLTASPEYFRPADPAKAGTWEQPRLDAWREAATDWLRQRYGDRLVRATIHLDESTPHIHAVTVPVDDRGRLNARDLFGPGQLVELQTSYGQAVQHLGLERGLRHSQAQHIEVRQFYGVVRSPMPTTPKIQIPDKGLLENKQEYQQKVDQAVNQQVQPFLVQLHAQAAMSELERRRADDERDSRQRIQQKLSEAELTKKQLQDQLRSIPLVDVLACLGAERDRGDPHKWHVHDKPVSVTGEKFKFWDGRKGGAGSISFVMQAEGLDFATAVEWLSQHFSAPQIAATAHAEVKQIAVETPKQPVEIPPPSLMPTHVDQVRNYLERDRGIDHRVVEYALDHGLAHAVIHPTSTQTIVNVGFPVVAEGHTVAMHVRGLHAEHPYVRNVGPILAGSWEIGRGRELVLVESPIEALSLVSLLSRVGHDVLDRLRSVVHIGKELLDTITEPLRQMAHRMQTGMIMSPREFTASEPLQGVLDRFTVRSTFGLHLPTALIMHHPTAIIAWNNDASRHDPELGQVLGPAPEAYRRAQQVHLRLRRWLPKANDWNDELRQVTQQVGRLEQQIEALRLRSKMPLQEPQISPAPMTRRRRGPKL